MLRCRATVLRYRPGRRCTLRIDAWLRDGQTGALSKRTWFGKLYHKPAKADPAYQDMLLLADSAPARAGRVLLARPTVYLPDLLMVLQEPVGGVPLDLLIGRMDGAATAGDPRGWEGIVRAAPALAFQHLGDGLLVHEAADGVGHGGTAESSLASARARQPSSSSSSAPTSENSPAASPPARTGEKSGVPSGRSIFPSVGNASVTPRYVGAVAVGE